MTVEDDHVRILCLFDELETSSELLKSGFGHLQEVDMGSTFYHLPHQLLASGLERLMKCYNAAVRKGRDSEIPVHDMRREVIPSVGEEPCRTVCWQR